RQLRRQELRGLLVGHEPLPELIVAREERVAAGAGGAAIVAPWVAAKELVAPGAGQDNLDEPAGEPRNVEVRITLADAQILQVPNQLRQYPFHVAGVHHHLVVLGLQQVREKLGAAAFVEAELQTRRGAQIESLRE